MYRAGWHGTDVAVKKLRSQGGGERCSIGVGSASQPEWDKQPQGIYKTLSIMG